MTAIGKRTRVIELIQKDVHFYLHIYICIHIYIKNSIENCESFENMKIDYSLISNSIRRK